MNYKKLLYAGISIFLISTLTGIVGTVWSIYSAFDSLEKAESVGIGPIGAGIERALAFTIVYFIGSVIGIGMMIFAGVKLQKK